MELTYSLVAFDPKTRSWGAAVASRVLAVGGLALAGTVDCGIVVTQGWANIAFKSQGLSLLQESVPADQVVVDLAKEDSRIKSRQFLVVDGKGNTAAFTGEACPTFAGQVVENNLAIAGNTLVGGSVLDLMHKKWLEVFDEEAFCFPLRLLLTLQAGELAGGDRRGRQSAAVLVLRHNAGQFDNNDVETDLRVDDEDRPIDGLIRMLAEEQ